MRLALALALCIATPVFAAPYGVVEKDIATLQADMTAGRVTAVELVQAYQARIAAIDKSGPTLNSVIALNPQALAQAAALDAERRARGLRGPLHGIPILVKDNIEAAELPTTAGSLALASNRTGRDAPVVARLRAAGAIILGKANLSEWANFRSSRSISGWSGIGGLVKNPYVLDRSACGSSAGSGTAVAASLAAAALGSETNGSLVCPGSLNGIVSLKPTVGLVSRTHIIPISHTQDTAGPMTRSVADAALLLAVMAGSDPADPVTAPADAQMRDYAAARATLAGKRLGVLLPAGDTEADRVFLDALKALEAAGARIVPVTDFTVPPGSSADETALLQTEFKSDLNRYLATLPAGQPRTLADIIAFNTATPRELALFGQDTFEKSQARPDLADPEYQATLARLVSGMRALLERTFAQYRLDALLQPTNGPAFRIDIVRGNNSSGSSSSVPAIAGTPHLTVPMGMVHGLPVGISLSGLAWSEAPLLALGAAVEKALPARKAPQFLPSLEDTPQSRAAFAPAGR